MSSPAPTRTPSTLFDDACAVLESWPAPSAEQDRLRSAYLEHLGREGEPGLRRGGPHHLTASCVVLSHDLTKVALVLHKKAQEWFQPGGHLETADLTLRDAAAREAAEETGLVGLVLSAAPVDLDHHQLSGAFGTCRSHLDVRYAAVAPVDAELVTSVESDDVRWFDVDAAPPGLTRLVRAGIDALQSLESAESAETGR